MPSTSDSAYNPADVIDTTQDDQVQEDAGNLNDHEHDGDDDEHDSDQHDPHDENDEHDPHPESSSQSTSTAATKKKKKKSKSKAAKALRALTSSSSSPSSSSSRIPQQLVNHVLDTVREQNAPGSAEVTEENVREVMQQMRVVDTIKGKAGIGGGNVQEIGTHKFWATQPVPQPHEGPAAADGHIEPSKPRAEVRQEPYPLPADFEWSAVDIGEPNQIKELYDLLSGHYVEDDDASFRFQYSAEFLYWALRPPGYHKEWHVGVRVRKTGRLVAFISGVPLEVRVRKNTFPTAEINYLCIHKKLRSKRLTPVLIKEVTRQVNLKGVFQAVYTAGVVIPTPVAVCRYYHRSLNPPKLIDVQFSYVPRGSTLARLIRDNALPPTPGIPGLREMRRGDVGEVGRLFGRYMGRFDMAPVFGEEEVGHQFLSGRGRGEGEGGEGKGTSRWRREGQVTWSYVVEDPQTHKITDFFSFYSLPSTIINHPKHGVLEAAYMYYYASDVAFQTLPPSTVSNAQLAPLGVYSKPSGNARVYGGIEQFTAAMNFVAERDARLKERLKVLVGDALIVAGNAGFDVFNALTLMDNVDFLEDLKFGAGDGYLNFYLYNWRTAPLAGMNSVDRVKPGRGVGLVML